MPASELPDVPIADPPPEAVLLERLEAAVDRILDAHGAAQRQAEGAEAAYAELRSALHLSGANPDEEKALEERLERLAEENRGLRETLAQARERAERIRNRLMVVEDEL